MYCHMPRVPLQTEHVSCSRLQVLQNSCPEVCFPCARCGRDPSTAMSELARHVHQARSCSGGLVNGAFERVRRQTSKGTNPSCLFIHTAELDWRTRIEAPANIPSITTAAKHVYLERVGFGRILFRNTPPESDPSESLPPGSLLGITGCTKREGCRSWGQKSQRSTSMTAGLRLASSDCNRHPASPAGSPP